MIRYAVKSRIGTYYNFIREKERFGLSIGCLNKDRERAEMVARHKVSGGRVEVYEVTLKETYTPEPKQGLPELDFSVG